MNREFFKGYFNPFSGGIRIHWIHNYYAPWIQVPWIQNILHGSGFIGCKTLKLRRSVSIGSKTFTLHRSGSIWAATLKLHWIRFLCIHNVNAPWIRIKVALKPPKTCEFSSSLKSINEESVKTSFYVKKNQNKIWNIGKHRLLVLTQKKLNPTIFLDWINRWNQFWLKLKSKYFIN